MTPKFDENLFCEQSRSRSYNIHLKGGGMHSRVTIRSFEGLRPADIEWVWILEIRRRATPKEIQLLCAIKR